MFEVVEVVDINLAAVLVAALAFFVVGAVWYSPALFGKQWSAAAKIKESEMRGAGAAPAMIGSFLSYLVAIYALAYLSALLGVNNAAEGMTLASIASVGLYTPLALSNALYHKTRRLLWTINTGYVVAGFLVVGAILGAWQ